MTPNPEPDLKNWQKFNGGNKRPDGGTLSRFKGTGSKHARRDQAALRPDHDALLESRTLFPHSVVSATASPRVLVSGINSSKIGRTVLVGPWRGFPIYTVTLEERASCPSSCHLLDACYGNAMPFARRHEKGAALEARLDRDLRAMAQKHPKGFAIRLHVLGDFYSADYLLAWFRWMNEFPALHVWGYTAHQAKTKMGGWILRGNDRWPTRWAFRTSVSPKTSAAPMQATTIWHKPTETVIPEGTVCPMQMDLTQACATCGLCWALPAASKRIVFIGHGKRNVGRSKSKAP